MKWHNTHVFPLYVEPLPIQYSKQGFPYSQSYFSPLFPQFLCNKTFVLHHLIIIFLNTRCEFKILNVSSI